MKVFTIGRAPTNNIVINDPSQTVSKHHARLELSDDGTIIMYDDSANGTFVNNQKYHKQSFRVKRGDFINFAGVAPLDWTQIPEVNIVAKAKAKSKPSGNAISPKSNFKWWHVALPMLLLATGALAYFMIPNMSASCDSEAIYEKYNKSVGLIVHGFLYEMVEDDQPIAYIGWNKKILKEKQELIWDFAAPKDKDKLHPIVFRGTGFFASNGVDNGNIITNKHITNPSISLNDKSLAAEVDPILKEIKEIVMRIVTEAKIKGGDFDLSKMRWREETDFIGILPNTNFLKIEQKRYDEIYERYKNKFIECDRIAYSIDKNVDLALIRTESMETPKNCTVVNVNTDSEFDKNELKPGAPATIIGFPALSNSILLEVSESNQLKAIVVEGTISQQPNRYDVQYDITSKKGASGSPVFNDQCELIAVNYRGNGIINYGILGGYIINLLNEDMNAVVSE